MGTKWFREIPCKKTLGWKVCLRFERIGIRRVSFDRQFRFF